jgi:hypothetical protein
MLSTGLSTPSASPSSSLSHFQTMSGSVSETISVGTGSVSVANSFWGTNVRVYSSIGSVDAARFNQTIDKWVRWPGGQTGENLNITSGVITKDDGSTYSAPQSVSSFVAWCATINCRSIIQLPSEINDTSTAK